MKIAVATDDFSTVTGHIGRCNGFLVYDIEAGEITSRVEMENSFTNHKLGENDNHEHGHNHGHSHQRLVDALLGCSHLICTAAGWRVVEDLKNNNIEVVFTNEYSADIAAVKFAKGELQINEEGVCRAH